MSREKEPRKEYNILKVDVLEWAWPHMRKGPTPRKKTTNMCTIRCAAWCTIQKVSIVTPYNGKKTIYKLSTEVCETFLSSDSLVFFQQNINTLTKVLLACMKFSDLRSINNTNTSNMSVKVYRIFSFNKDNTIFLCSKDFNLA